MKNVLIITLAVVGLLGAQVSWAELLVFGPDIYTNTPGKSQKIVKTFSVQNPQKKFTISIQSVERHPGRKSSAVIELNGIRVVAPNEFNKEVVTITKPIKLQKQNKIAVEVQGYPGTWVAVSILGPERPSVKGTIGPKGGTVTLKGFASVTFPPGAFTAGTPVTVSVTSSPETAEDFSETAEGPRLPYEIRINSGNVASATSFDVVLDVPDTFINSLPPDAPQIDVFAQIYDEGDGEIIDQFHGFDSTFEPVAKTVRSTLHGRGFTNQRRPNLTYEAIVIVGAIPTLPPLGAAPSSSSSSPVQLSPAQAICEGSPLGPPLAGDLIPTSPFKAPHRPDHQGVDYGAPEGTDVLAVADATVVQPMGLSRTWGRYVILRHNDGSQTLYAHLQLGSTDHLTQGQIVTTGTRIGNVGTTGRVTGPNLHLEYSPTGRIFEKRRLVDPHPCVAPLQLTSPDPTLMCGSPNPIVNFTATGGWPPYTWTRTPTIGVLTPSGDTLTATLRPPQSAMFPGTAYKMFNRTCVSGLNTRTRMEFGCNDNVLVDCVSEVDISSLMTCGGVTQEWQCTWPGCAGGGPGTCDTCSGVNLSSFQTCLNSGKYASEIRKDLEDGLRAGVNGTPTLFLGTQDSDGQSVKVLRTFLGAQPYEQYKLAIEDALKDLNK